MTYNPLARQRRLSAALMDLRTTCGYSHAELARISGVSASYISRIENPFGRINWHPDLLYVRKLLDALNVVRGSDQFATLDQYAEQAANGGWWDDRRYSRMGGGQREFAIVEAGAATIREYAGLLLPGLVQTEAYARHRVTSAAGGGPVDPDAIVAGRMERQQRSLHPDSADYELVLEEQAVRRYPVPPEVMADQLRHLLVLAEQPNVSLCILPVDANLGAGQAPRAPYAHMTYPDPDDPMIVIVDNVTRALVVHDADEVEGYAQLHKRLCGAALSASDSAAVIREVVDSLATAS